MPAPADRPLQFSMTIESGNAACQTREDVAALLEAAAAKLREFRITPEHLTATVHDANGNRVGSWLLRWAKEPGDV